MTTQKVYKLITLRSARRKTIFFSHRENLQFLEILKQCASKLDIDTHAYSLFRNHARLMVSADHPGQVGAFIDALQQQFNQWLSQHHPHLNLSLSERCCATIASHYDQVICMIRIESAATEIIYNPQSSEHVFSSYRFNFMGLDSYIVKPCDGYLRLGNNMSERLACYRDLSLSPTRHEEFERVDRQHHNHRLINHRTHNLKHLSSVKSADIRYLDR